MRVITGSARGRKLVSPESTDTRPTSDMVKEAAMSMVQFDIEGARVLDLFAGSGQMGIEALSRGARTCVFVDNSKHACDAIQENIRICEFGSQSRLVRSDAESFLASYKEKFDFAFIDPPYADHAMMKILPMAASLMAQSGIILCETSLDEKLPENIAGFKLFKEYRYGKKKITQYRNNDVE